MSGHLTLGILLLTLCSLPAAARDKKATDWVKHGVELAGKSQFDEAVKAFSRALELDPKNADVHDLRGSAYFMLGKFKESVADFDRAVELAPEKSNGHWRRGISLYYAGKYTEGMKQFQNYEKVSTTDVENAIWHLMCAARKDGLAAARKNVLKIAGDTRVPMMEVYELFKGTIKPEAVLAAANASRENETERNRGLFYAHLYLGIYYDLTGEKKRAMEHLALAKDKYKIRHYMGEVPRVHHDVLTKQKDR